MPAPQNLSARQFGPQAAQERFDHEPGHDPEVVSRIDNSAHDSGIGPTGSFGEPMPAGSLYGYGAGTLSDQFGGSYYD